jgi:hypothetical protein
MLTGGPSAPGYMGGMGGMTDLYGMSNAMRGYSMMGHGMGGPSSKMAMLMGFNHLNTIEEEKHETQTSNYFRDGERERDDSNVNNTNIRGSRILDDEFMNENSKISPNRAGDNYEFSKAGGVKEEEEYEDEYDDEAKE